MSDPRLAQAPVVVAGGGWAGLACAFELCRRDIPVVLIEAARQLGGRARSVRFRDTIVDNGQHLLTGACHSLLAMLQQLQIDPQRVFIRIPLTLHSVGGAGSPLQLRAPRLPAPLHLLAALLGASGLSPADRLLALRFGRRLTSLDIPAGQDISVQALLHSEAQTPALIAKLWEPLCIATLNTAIEEASARIYLRVLRETFVGLRGNSDLLIPKVELGNLLPVPCRAFLEDNGARVVLGARVTGLEIQAGRIEGVTAGAQTLAASHLVLATPHVISRRLMSTQRPLRALCEKMAALGNEPVTTLYLQYPQAVRLPQPVTGLCGGIAQWIIDRSPGGAAGLVAVVISARGTHMQMDSDALCAKVTAELAAMFPDWPAPRDSLVIREKRATFCSRVGIDEYRPANRTPVRGLWLAGDYTDNGLPATLEGAVRSGVACAQAIANSL
ncbi:MAG: FAD-dependent oxidoreductase [Thiogranum sp.]|nr:FAD-dependent oxidoreductase [Thiogranum sp.]